VYRRYQTSPRILIENFRLEKALFLIRENNANLYKICQQTGFAYTKTFREAIKRRFNMTPSALKKLFQNTTEPGALYTKLRAKLWQDETRAHKTTGDNNRR